MSLDPWSSLQTVPLSYEAGAFEPLPCRSTFTHATGGRLRCSLDADHLQDPFDPRHGDGPVFRWSEEQAAAERTALLASFAGWLCLSCERPCDRRYYQGCCTRACSNREACR
ncbi:hypothetical protein [Streptacidiphilus sp. PAMC 29251]